MFNSCLRLAPPFQAGGSAPDATGPAVADRVADRYVPPAAAAPELKGSVGEGPNQTNYSDQSLIRILAKFKNFR